jgi:hypothetical protein
MAKQPHTKEETQCATFVDLLQRMKHEKPNLTLEKRGSLYLKETLPVKKKPQSQAVCVCVCARARTCAWMCWCMHVGNYVCVFGHRRTDVGSLINDIIPCILISLRLCAPVCVWIRRCSGNERSLTWLERMGAYVTNIMRSAWISLYMYVWLCTCIWKAVPVKQGSYRKCDLVLYMPAWELCFVCVWIYKCCMYVWVVFICACGCTQKI